MRKRVTANCKKKCISEATERRAGEKTVVLQTLALNQQHQRPWAFIKHNGPADHAPIPTEWETLGSQTVCFKKLPR